MPTQIYTNNLIDMDFYKIISNLKTWLASYDLSSSTVNLISSLIVLACIIVVSWFANYITKTIILAITKKFVKKTKATWDDIMLEQKVFHKLSQLVPILIVYYAIELAFMDYNWAILLVNKLTIVYLIILIVRIIFSFLNSLDEIYAQNVGAKKGTSIKSIMQVLKIFVLIVAVIITLSYLLNKEVGYFITGLGAMTAVLMLIFKDSILGLVGGVQLTTNDMVRIGDWISMPSKNIDGDVIEVGLNTVKVQNFDKTISTIPPYTLMTESFSNWRGMKEAGGRRIKRSVKIDMSSVKFCDDELLDRLSKIHLIKDYIAEKSAEIEEYNKTHQYDLSVLANGRRMTNLGTFRMYMINYLRANENIKQDMTLLVRQLESTQNGLPLEIYTFTASTEWPVYEKIQSDIFDHIFAVLPEFDLRVYQAPSGEDFKSVKS